MEDSTRHTCLRLELGKKEGVEGEGTEEPSSSSSDRDVVFIKGTWFDDRFSISITDGSDAWICSASKSDVLERAKQWDQSVAEYIEVAERYLGFQQPGSLYRFVDSGDGSRRLSWTFDKQGMKLECRWKCQPSSNSKQTTAEVLHFLMDANIRLSEEVVRKTQSFERLKVEAEKSLSQSEKLCYEKREFESSVYAKFVGVLNSKKTKLRELRDQLSKHEATRKSPQDEEDESTDRTEVMEDSDDRVSEEEHTKNHPHTSKSSPAAKVQKRKVQR